MLRSRHEQREMTRAVIVAAARTLFAEAGYEGTTTQSVATAAGVAGGTVFVHFADKGALLRAVLEEGEIAALGAAVASLPAGGIVRQLVSLGEALFRHHAADRRLGAAYLRETLFDTTHTGPDGLVHRAAALLDAARIRGEIERSVDPRLGAATFLALTQGGIVAVLRDGVSPAQQGTVLAAQLQQYLRPGPRA